MLLEQSDNEGEAQARARFEALLEAALERGLIDDAAVAESLAQSQRVWHLRESIPLAQSLGRAEHQARHRAAGVGASPTSSRAPTPRWQRAFPGVRLVDFGHLGDGNLHYNVQAPAGRCAAGVPATSTSTRSTRSSTTRCARVGGSISAEHGIGALKRDELARRKSPVALQMMRAIKQALDPHGRLNPGRVL